MKSILNNRYVILLLGIFSLGALMMLAASLSNLRFEKPLFLAFEKSTAPSDAQRGALANASIWESFLFFLLISILLFIIIAILNKDTRKQVIRSLLRVALLFLVLNFILNTYQEQVVEPEAATAEAQSQPSFDVEKTTLNFIPPDVDSSYVYIITFFVLMVALAFLYWWFVVRKPPEPEAELEEIAAIAKTALGHLNADNDWKNAIIECYVRMSEAVQTWRGLTRTEAMTPAEFSTRLVHAGLPAVAVTRLTTLFEAVRYGAKNSNPEDIAVARASLQEIISACAEVIA